MADSVSKALLATLFANPSSPVGMLPMGVEGEGQYPAVTRALMAQAGEPSPGEYLPQREFQPKLPPVATPPVIWNDDMYRLWSEYSRPRVEVLKEGGMPPHEAWRIIEEMPDVLAERERIEKEYGATGVVPPGTLPRSGR